MNEYRIPCTACDGNGWIFDYDCPPDSTCEFCSGKGYDVVSNYEYNQFWDNADKYGFTNNPYKG